MKQLPKSFSWMTRPVASRVSVAFPNSPTATYFYMETKRKDCDDMDTFERANSVRKNACMQCDLACYRHGCVPWTHGTFMLQEKCFKAPTFGQNKVQLTQQEGCGFDSRSGPFQHGVCLFVDSLASSKVKRTCLCGAWGALN